MNKRTILIVPPRGTSLKSIRIRLPVAIILGIIIVVGFAGLLLPFNTPTSNVAEQNQRKNLTEQNRALLQKIISTLRILKDLKTQVSHLEMKQQNVAQICGDEGIRNAKLQDSIDFSSLKSDELLTYVKTIESRFAPFILSTNDSDNVFDSLPVLSPITQLAPVSRHFGVALDPFSGKKRHHNGTDFVAEMGTPVIATASGIVQRIEKHVIWGNKVIINHGAGFSTIYAHLGAIKTTQGRQVKRGEVIGEIGLSGLSSGPHVHYEVWHSGEVVDPEEYLFPHDLIAKK
jgi:murein DD-endopeptidase MepM/ murein hydrolase activator NlpD